MILVKSGCLYVLFVVVVVVGIDVEDDDAAVALFCGLLDPDEDNFVSSLAFEFVVEFVSSLAFEFVFELALEFVKLLFGIVACVACVVFVAWDGADDIDSSVRMLLLESSNVFAWDDNDDAEAAADDDDIDWIWPLFKRRRRRSPPAWTYVMQA